MWWEEFEKRLTSAFVTIDRDEGRMVYSEQQKLWLLMGKVNADFLSQIRSTLTIQMSQVPMVLTYNPTL